jgi:hypothetical protein
MTREGNLAPEDGNSCLRKKSTGAERSREWRNSGRDLGFGVSFPFYRRTSEGDA